MQSITLKYTLGKQFSIENIQLIHKNRSTPKGIFRKMLLVEEAIC